MSKKVEFDSRMEPETVCQRFQRFLRVAEVGKYSIKGDLTKCDPDVSGHIVLVDEKHNGPWRDDEIVNKVTISECRGDPCKLYLRRYHSFPYYG